MKSRQGIMPAYNAQAVVSLMGGAEGRHRGMLITAAKVVAEPTDYRQLRPMLEEAEGITGARTHTVLADAGYYTGANLAAGHARGQMLVIPQQQRGVERGGYFKDEFRYDEATDSYRCPEGQRLHFRGLGQTRGKTPVRVYAALKQVCHHCPAYGVCTKDKHAGRVLWIGPDDLRLRQHRTWMGTEEARRLYAQRKGLIEPVFGIIKEQMGGRRFLLRGLANVRAEFAMLATAFNLRMLWKQWTTRCRPSLGGCLS
jgi:transposase